MWKHCAIAFCLGGLVVGAIVNRGIDRTMTAEYVQMTQIRVAFLSQAMVDTCFFDRIDPAGLEARLEPAGFRAASSNTANNAQFSGTLVDRLSFVDAGGVTECSALLRVGLRPTHIDTCRTAIEFNRSLNSVLQRGARTATTRFELVHRAGLVNARPHQERCLFRPIGQGFAWALKRDGVDFHVTLNSEDVGSPVSPLAPAYRFSIRRATSTL